MSSRWSLLLENMSISRNLSNDITVSILCFPLLNAPMFQHTQPTIQRSDPKKPTNKKLTKNRRKKKTKRPRLSDFEIQTIHNEVDEDQNLGPGTAKECKGEW